MVFKADLDDIRQSFKDKKHDKVRNDLKQLLKNIVVQANTESSIEEYRRWQDIRLEIQHVLDHLENIDKPQDDEANKARKHAHLETILNERVKEI